MNNLVQDALSLAEPELIGCVVSVCTDLQPDLPFAYGNKLRLQTAIYNLVCNAITGAASARSRVLTVQSQRQNGGHIAVSLVCDGPGGRAAVLKRALDIFSTAEHDPFTARSTYFPVRTSAKFLRHEPGVIISAPFN